VKTRVAFGKPLVEQGTILANIAQSRVEIEQARLLVLKAAHLMDVAGNKVGSQGVLRASQMTEILRLQPGNLSLLTQQTMEKAWLFNINDFSSALLGTSLATTQNQKKTQ
jgi:alkylation response protein AidB-like acyl-CoA dehydrogenase